MAPGPGLEEEGQTHSWRASEPRTTVVKETPLGGQAGRVPGGLPVTEHGGCSTHEAPHGQVLGEPGRLTAAWRGDHFREPGRKRTAKKTVRSSQRARGICPGADAFAGWEGGHRTASSLACSAPP